jgi:D-glycero-alpha-D-manno-heptose-7-phosphate kinase
MQEMVKEAVDILVSGRDIREFGLLLDETWCLKKQLSREVSNDIVDNLYGRAIAAGAMGGKITGAGGGGFLLLFVPPAKQKVVRESLGDKIHVPFRFESQGSQIIFYEPQKNYTDLEKDRANRKIDAFRELSSIPNRIVAGKKAAVINHSNSRIGMI